MYFITIVLAMVYYFVLSVVINKETAIIQTYEFFRVLYWQRSLNLAKNRFGLQAPAFFWFTPLWLALIRRSCLRWHILMINMSRFATIAVVTTTRMEKKKKTRSQYFLLNNQSQFYHLPRFSCYFYCMQNLFYFFLISTHKLNTIDCGRCVICQCSTIIIYYRYYSLLISYY